MAILVTGGARSGKSRFAEAYAVRFASRGVYVATAQPFDDEMDFRIRTHRVEREQSGFAWETIEEPLDLAGLLDRLAAGMREGTAVRSDTGDARSGAHTVRRRSDCGTDAGRTVVLVDCLTLWLTNHLLAVSPDGNADISRIEREMDSRIADLADAIRRFPHPLVLVTNEVGGGIVPETPLGRLFRDAAGRMNQRIAAICDNVFLVVSGIPVELKAIAFRMDGNDGGLFQRN